VQLVLDIRAGLIGASTALITLLSVIEYHDRPELRAKVRRILWGQ
jgi:hypothetical protein